MLLSYFDEAKYNPPNYRYFFIGGITLSAEKAVEVEESVNRLALNFFGTSVLGKENEFHGKDIFHGKGACKGRQSADRMLLLQALADILNDEGVHKFLVRIDVEAHREKYKFPMPEYNLGLMLLIERIDTYLARVGECGMLFGDNERDESTNSIVSLSEFKHTGTQFYFGQRIERLVDTLYFAHSHHSRFIQLADVCVYIMQMLHYNERGNAMRGAFLDYVVQNTGLAEAGTVTAWPK